MKLGKMSSIEQYRNVVKHLINSSQFMGMSDEGEPIYDKLEPKPVVEFTGTIKLHGTNASVGYDHIGNIWAQSKSNIITPLNDNHGFAQFVHKKEEMFHDILKAITLGENQVVYLYGEWAGIGIQRGVAVSELEKSFYAFALKMQTLDENNEVLRTSYLPVDFKNDIENRIFNIYNFPTFKASVDCSEPHVAQNMLVALVAEIEKECPVAKELGVSGIGEGLVFVGDYKENRYTFKVKGEKHAGKSKIKKLNKVDDAKINLVNETVNKVLPTWRLDQFFNEVVGEDTDRKKLGDYIRAVLSDVVKEEIDVLSDAGLTVKDIGKTVSDQARNYFFEREKMSQ